MSQLGKILLYVACLGGLVAIGAGVMVVHQRGDDATALSQSRQEVTVANGNTKKVQAEADAATAAQKQAESDLADQKTKIDDLNSKLSDAQSKATTLQSAVQTSQDATAKAQAALDHVNSVLGGKTPEDMKAEVDKLNSQVAADNAEQKILQDQLQAAVKQADDYKKEIDLAKTGTIAPGVTGKVTFVNRTWNFVVLNVGLSNGVVPNGELVVYRGRDFLGKVKITSAEDNTAVADILPGAKADIQVGDDVIN
jgi:cell shape-determining protein MreC